MNTAAAPASPVKATKPALPTIDKRRKALIAQIHIVRKQLVDVGVMDDDGYRAALRSATTSKFHTTGKDSCTLMSEFDLMNALRDLRKIANLHKLPSTTQTVPSPYAAKTPTTNKAADDFANKVATARPLERKLWAVWNAMGRAGKLETPGEYGLYAFVKRRTDCDRPRFCTDKQLNDLIEQVKAWDVRHTPTQSATHSAAP
jgi:hypothetical protein